MTTVGTASASPGEKETGRLQIGEARDGSPVGLPVCVVNGADSGRTVYIQAASDGDELNGVGVLTRVVPQLDPAEMSGTILIVGIANYFGFQQATHRNPIDDTKLNRAYPGSPEGSTTERIVHATFQVGSRADLALDLHQGSTSRMIEETRIRCGHHHRRHGDCLELAKAFDCGYVLDQKGPDGQLARVLTDEGVPTIDPELGASIGWDESSIAAGVRGVKNVLGHYGVLDRDVEMIAQTRATGFDRYNAPVGGLVRFEAELGDRIERGEELFVVTDPFGAVKETVSATGGGIFWRARRLPQAATGEYVCSIGTDIDEY
jgi:predicted deacylase